jgi:hypothetical protein
MIGNEEDALSKRFPPNDVLKARTLPHLHGMSARVEMFGQTVFAVVPQTDANVQQVSHARMATFVLYRPCSHYDPSMYR